MYGALMDPANIEHQLSIAFDWLRTAVAQTRDPDRQRELRREMTQLLATKAIEISGWTPLDSEIHQRRTAAAEATWEAEIQAQTEPQRRGWRSILATQRD
jgi:hypothetical protein